MKDIFTCHLIVIIPIRSVISIHMYSYQFIILIDGQKKIKEDKNFRHDDTTDSTELPRAVQRWCHVHDFGV